MDPTACLRRIMDASKVKGGGVEFSTACTDLASWLSRGGFKPHIPGDLKYIPGTGTRWSVMSPAPDRWAVWTLVRWDGIRDKAVESHPLE